MTTPIKTDTPEDSKGGHDSVSLKRVGPETLPGSTSIICAILSCSRYNVSNVEVSIKS